MKPLTKLSLGVAGIVLVLIVWQLIAIGPLAGSSLPTATDTLAEFVRILPTPELWSAIGVTVVMALGGLLLAIIVGVILGVATGTSPVTMAATRAVVEFLKPIPPIVILPLVVLVLGPTTEMGFFLVFYGCVLPITMQTTAGVFDVDPVAVSTMRSFSMGRTEILWRVVLPSATSYIGTAIRVNAPVSLIIAVVAGLLGGSPGLGQSLLRAQLSGAQTLLFALVIVLGLIGLAFQFTSETLERRVLHWHPSYREDLR